MLKKYKLFYAHQRELSFLLCSIVDDFNFSRSHVIRLSSTVKIQSVCLHTYLLPPLLFCLVAFVGRCTIVVLLFLLPCLSLPAFRAAPDINTVTMVGNIGDYPVLYLWFCSFSFVDVVMWAFGLSSFYNSCCS